MKTVIKAAFFDLDGTMLETVPFGLNPKRKLVIYLAGEKARVI